MELLDLGIIALFVLAFGLISGRLDDTIITAPMAFLAFGLATGPSALGIIDLDLDDSAVRTLAEATLVLVLFSDAARIDVRELRREAGLPTRLLGVGLPLTILAGGAVAAIVFDDLVLAEAFLLGAVLAPTDAALGQVVVSSHAIPARVRQALNVESGLNDGIALPVITVLLAIAAADEQLGPASEWVRFAAEQIGYGALIGIASGAIGGRLVDAAASKGWLHGSFRQLASLALAVAAFGLASAAGGNGFIAAFTAGAAFGAVARATCGEGIVRFTEAEGQLLGLLTFLLFGAVIVGPSVDQVSWRIVGYALASLTVVRMLPAALSLTGARLHGHTVAFLAWFGPRGLASILFALLIVEEAGIAGAEEILLVATWTVVFSVVAHGVSALPIAGAYARHIATRRSAGAAIAEHEPVHEHAMRRSAMR